MTLREKAFDVAAHIWTDVLGKRGDYAGWAEDKEKAAMLILALLSTANSEKQEGAEECAACHGTGMCPKGTASNAIDRLRNFLDEPAEQQEVADLRRKLEEKKS